MKKIHLTLKTFVNTQEGKGEKVRYSRKKKEESMRGKNQNPYLPSKSINNITIPFFPQKFLYGNIIVL